MDVRDRLTQLTVYIFVVLRYLLFTPQMSFRQALGNVCSKWSHVFQWTMLTVPPLVAFHDNIASVQMVAGQSMSPTLNPPGSRLLDIVFVSKVSNFTVNDVILLRDPVREDRTLIVKRVADVPQDGSSVYVLGDNANHSTDSRHFGSVPSHLVEGVVKAVVFPPWRWTSDLSKHPSSF
jgi:inner membrane protease subunit 2